VTGTVLPVAEIASIAHQTGALLLVDAAQTAGVLPINMSHTGIDLLAFTGHKDLQGPPGIGGLVIADKVDVSWIEPLMRGARAAVLSQRSSLMTFPINMKAERLTWWELPD